MGLALAGHAMCLGTVSPELVVGACVVATHAVLEQSVSSPDTQDMQDVADDAQHERDLQGLREARCIRWAKPALS